MPQNSHNAFRGCLGDNYDFTLRCSATEAKALWKKILQKPRRKKKKRAVKSLITLDKYAVLVGKELGANVQSCQVFAQQLDRSSSRVAVASS